MNKKFSDNEIILLLRLAMPLVLSGLVTAATSFFSTIFLAHLGREELAAGALVIWLFATLMVIVWGTLSSVSALVAQKHGANDNEGVSHVLRDGLLLALLFVFPAALLLWNIEPIFLFIGQSPSTVVLSLAYIHGLVWGLPADFVGLVLMQFIIGLGHTRTSLAFTVLLVPINIVITYGLMFGNFGLPALGMAGIGWGTTIAFWITTLLMLMYLVFNPVYKHYINKMLEFSHLHYLRELFHIGMPMGIMFSFEVAYFLTLTLLMGHLGIQQLAANQIAFQYMGYLSVVTFSIAQAVTVRMGHTLGAENVTAAKNSCYFGVYMATIFMGLVAVCYWAFPLKLIAIDFDVHNPTNERIVNFAIQFLKVSALFQLFEAIRITLFGALRSLKDTRFTLFISIISFWGIALPMGYLFSFYWDGVGYWWGAVIGAALSAIFLWWRFRYKMNKIGL